jgi:hypothetical protein
MIDYVLENNLLTKDKPNDRYARVVNQRSRTENDLADAIARRNIGISKAEALVFRVTTQFSNSTKPLKTPRSVTFEKELTVV